MKTLEPPAVGVCEDDDQLRDILCLALERAGFTVHVTGSGEEAVEAFSTLVLQAIVLDISLPDADGRDVCQALRARGVATPIVFLTARDVLADRLSGFHAGGDDYVTKPFAISELLLRVGALIRRTGGADPGPSGRSCSIRPRTRSSWASGGSRSRRPNSGCWPRWRRALASCSAAAGRRGAPRQCHAERG